MEADGRTGGDLEFARQGSAVGAEATIFFQASIPLSTDCFSASKAA